MTPEAGWIDISLLVSSESAVYPGDPAVEVEPYTTLDTGPSHVTRIAMNSHTCTHVDAPAHFVRGAQTLAEIPLSRFNGPTWVLDLPQAEAITPEALAERWPEGPVERVLLKTPNSALWGTPAAGKTWQAVSPEAATWLVERKVGLVGIDSLSIEALGVEDFPVHHTLLGSGVVLLEGLDLSGVQAGRYQLMCLPLRLDAPDGAPARAVLRPL
jgi:arylformamidase